MKIVERKLWREQAFVRIVERRQRRAGKHVLPLPQSEDVETTGHYTNK